MPSQPPRTPMASLATTQTTWMAIMTSARSNDYEAANMLLNEWKIRYGDFLPLIIVGCSIANSILDAYATQLEETPETVLQSLALEILMKGENPNGQ